MTVFAVVLTDRHLDDQVAARLGRAGADKVLACEGRGLSAPPLDLTHGPALYAAVERVPPLLVLFPAGGAGTQLGPGLASRLGGAFAASADLEVGEAATPLADGIGRVFVRRWRADRTSYRRLDPVELERPVVAILAAGGAPADRGSGEVDVEVITCVPPAKVGVAELASEADDLAAAALAAIDRAREVSGAAFNVAGEPAPSMREVGDALAAGLGRSVTWVPVPKFAWNAGATLGHFFSGGGRRPDLGRTMEVYASSTTVQARAIVERLGVKFRDAREGLMESVRGEAATS